MTRKGSVMTGSDVLTDEVIAEKWAEVADSIEIVTSRTQDPNAFTVRPSSELSDDDVASHPYRLSQTARWCLNAGVDNLHALKCLVIDNGILHSAAPYGLVRGALENFGAGFWMLHPRDRATRVARGLRWWAKNFTDSDKATSGTPTYTPLQPMFDNIVEVAKSAGIKKPDATLAGYTSTEALGYANKHSQATRPHLCWQVCSGFAHGRPWANIGMNAMEQLSTTEDVITVKLTTDHKRLLAVTWPAVMLLEDFLRLYQDRAN